MARKFAPFESAALLYGLTPDNADNIKFYVRDDTFNICGRLLNTYGETTPEYEQCYSCAKDGMETLVKLTGRNPCAYRINRDLQTKEKSPYFEARKDGKSPEDSYDCCLNTGVDPKICILDYMSEALLLPEEEKKKSIAKLPQAKIETSQTKEKKEKVSLLSVTLYMSVVILLLYTIRKIFFKH